MPDLRPPKNDAELSAMHDLVARSFTPRPAKPAYDRNSPEDRDPLNHFLGYWDGAILLGTVRVDRGTDGCAILRKGAVLLDKRHNNLGHMLRVIRGLLAATEAFAKSKSYIATVFGTALGKKRYFQKFGYSVDDWPRSERDTITMPTVDMRKNLPL